VLITASSLHVTHILTQMLVTDDEVSRQIVVFHHSSTALAYALFAADNPIYADALLQKISSCIFVTLRYRDEDPIVEKPGAVIITNYASITIICNQRKTYTY